MKIVWKNTVGDIYAEQPVRDAADVRRTLLRELMAGGEMSTFGEPGDTIKIEREE